MNDLTASVSHKTVS